MCNLIKIRDVSSKYGISPRALRYYEDVGLITSTRIHNYAYRLYDKNAIKRLEQILILRKLNISIKDIQRIFNAPGSEVILEVLRKKADDIDEEVALLHELKEVVLEFVRQIKQVDFSNSSDVRMLYDKASKIETRLSSGSYNGSPAKETVNKLLDVTEKMKKIPEVRIIQVSPFRAFSSGLDTLDKVFGLFWKWQREHIDLAQNTMFGYPNFIGFENVSDETHAVWFWGVKDWVTEADTAPYELIDFEGGLYAVAMSVDGDDDICYRVYDGIKKWLETSEFESDERPGHSPLCHMVNPTEEIKRTLGYDQLDIYVPIKIRDKT